MRWMLPYHAVKPKNVWKAWSVSQLQRRVRRKERGQKLSLQSVTLLPYSVANRCTRSFVPSAFTVDKLWVQTPPTGVRYWLLLYYWRVNKNKRSRGVTCPEVWCEEEYTEESLNWMKWKEVNKINEVQLRVLQRESKDRSLYWECYVQTEQEIGKLTHGLKGSSAA